MARLAVALGATRGCASPRGRPLNVKPTSKRSVPSQKIFLFREARRALFSHCGVDRQTNRVAHHGTEERRPNLLGCRPLGLTGGAGCLPPTHVRGGSRAARQGRAVIGGSIEGGAFPGIPRPRSGQ